MSVPYRDVLGDEDPQRVLGETPMRLAAFYDTFTPEQLEARPAPGKWNLREIMAHLADCEIVWAWRLRYALEKDRAELQPFDQDPWAKMYTQYTLEAARATFNAVRSWNVAFIAGLTEEEKHKLYYHPERGEEPLWTLVEIMAGHDLHHLRLFEKAHVSG